MRGSHVLPKLTSIGNQKSYSELQRRIVRGDLSTFSKNDTYKLYRTGEGQWSAERTALHRRILDEAKRACSGKPRTRQAAIFTAGPGGVGKSTAWRKINELQRSGDQVGEKVREAIHGVKPEDCVVLDPDAFKEALVRHGGLPELPAESHYLANGKKVAPAECASLLHRESIHLEYTFGQWARAEGYNVVFDGTLRDLKYQEELLANLEKEGYQNRTVISVEASLSDVLDRNAERWEKGRKEFDLGRSEYGGRMAPQVLIEALYDSNKNQSLGRKNAHILFDKGGFTDIITVDALGEGGLNSKFIDPSLSITVRHRGGGHALRFRTLPAEKVNYGDVVAVAQAASPLLPEVPQEAQDFRQAPVPATTLNNPTHDAVLTRTAAASLRPQGFPDGSPTASRTEVGGGTGDAYTRSDHSAGTRSREGIKRVL
ncbi:zeta toxin family protein [Streptomyces sp. MMS24-I2-30]|uniref:zeta toxin family protein n=1 Tax=Streptomyces sp. MMS24-I2-30 TaxID=3351564 RepID=UPI0038969A47